MPSNNPFIHPFRTRGRYYVFDANTNRIINVDKEIYNYLQGKTENISELAMQTIDEMKRKGFLKEAEIKHILHPASFNLRDILENALGKITLQVTQQCNLRCEYCIYSGDAGNYRNRPHQPKRMSQETAKKGIDFLISKSQDSNKINIGFYGGEPLLEFPLIMDCIRYTNERAEGKEASFTITTNATLLSDDIVKFLSENDVMLSISLDGPREIHNKNRKYAGSGLGTFDKVMENIENIGKKYPDYFSKILFNVVLDPSTDYKCVSEFFVDYDTVKDAQKNASLPSIQYSKHAVAMDELFRAEYNYGMFKILLHKLGHLKKECISSLNLSYFERLKEYYHEKRTLNFIHEYEHPGGPCIPGQMRLFMDVDGVFYPCERVSEASKVMRIGTVDDGIDVEKCMQLLNIGKLTESHCKNCWAFRYCTQCAAFADDTEKLTAEKRLSHCNSVKNSVESSFQDYCTLLELGYDFDNDIPVGIRPEKKEGA